MTGLHRSRPDGGAALVWRLTAGQLLGGVWADDQIVGYGRDDGKRNFRLCFRVTRVRSVGLRPPPRSTEFRVTVECEEGDPDYFAGGSVTR